MPMETLTLDQVINMAMKLPFEQREMLVDIIHRRQVEALRREIAADAEAALSEYRAGRFEPQPAHEIIRELREELENSE